LPVCVQVGQQGEFHGAWTWIIPEPDRGAFDGCAAA